MADIGVGNICNNNCIMCTAIMPPSKDYKQPPAKEIVDKIDRIKDDSITITGGEPSIREDIFTILEHINKNYPNKKINFITNSNVFYYNDVVKRYKKIKNLYVISELHADNEELHDKITQTEGSFKYAFQGIKNLLEDNFKVEFRIVISKLNYKNVPEIAKLIIKEFSLIDRVVIFPIDIIGNAFKNKNEVVVKYSELIPFVEKALDKLIEANVKLYHIPYCVIDEKYYKFIEKGITVLDRRVALADVCKGCEFEEDCPRVWKSYLKIIGKEEFNPIKNGPTKS